MPPPDDVDPTQDRKHARESEAATAARPPYRLDRQLAVGVVQGRLGEAGGRLILAQNALGVAILRLPPEVDATVLEEADELLREAGAKLAAGGVLLRQFVAAGGGREQAEPGDHDLGGEGG